MLGKFTEFSFLIHYIVKCISRFTATLKNNDVSMFIKEKLIEYSFLVVILSINSVDFMGQFLSMIKI